MSDFINSVDVLGDEAVISSIIDRSITEIADDSVELVGTQAFRECLALKTVDFPLATEIQSGAFYRCYKLTTLVLRNETVCVLSNTGAFTNAYHFHGTTNATHNPNGLKDGYIYVPKALVEEYKVATNWSTFATQFRVLEDYTVDGTIYGELDESKI